MKSGEQIIKWLFETEAVKIAPEGEAFFYTSGLIGPYYINTHFLYGSSKKAGEILDLINAGRNDIKELQCRLSEEIDRNYDEDRIFRGVIDSMTDLIRKEVDIEEIDYISGGERRDWFFSYKVADILGIPYLALYKNMKAVSVRDGIINEVESLKGKNVLHVVDLTNTASSHRKAWIPAIRNRGGNLKWNISVVDRAQGGSDYFKSEGISDYALAVIDKTFFEKAHTMGIINKAQMEFVHSYIEEPRESMKGFLAGNPAFIENAIASDDKKLSERAKFCVESDLYELK